MSSELVPQDKESNSLGNHGEGHVLPETRNICKECETRPQGIVL